MYITECFSSVYSEDGLAVVARGLGMNKVISKFIQLYATPTTSESSGSSSSSSTLERKLVLVINANKDSVMLRESLLNEGRLTQTYITPARRQACNQSFSRVSSG